MEPGRDAGAVVTDRPNAGATALGVIGIILYAGTGFFYLASGLMVPGVWLIALWAVWLIGVYLLVIVFRRRRAWTPLVAVGALVFWWVYVTLGEALLDWTA